MRRITVRSTACCALMALGVLAPAAGARVLRVGTYDGIKGPYRSIQSAVDAAKPGDWVLIAPGDYKETSGRAPAAQPDATAGVLVTTPGIHLRGLDRNGVVVDGTRAGAPRCSSAAADQVHGPGDVGLNGIMVYKADHVSVDNLTVCNYLHGPGGDTGNEIWWNGGDGSGQIGGHGFSGSYLNATSTFFEDEETAAQYGIFSSNWTGGVWDQSYTSNFNDSGYYIGACQQRCDQTIDHAWAQYSALGYSGTNSGGPLVIKNSEFDHNKDGFDTNSQNADFPSPQNGACPDGGTSPITGTHSCWVFMNNYVHDNNNPDVPGAGTAAEGPVGTGMSISGGRNDTVMHNVFARNDAWGIIVLPFLDSGGPCTGGTQDALGPGTCLFDQWGNAVLDNTFVDNGSYGHPTNGDIGAANFEPGHPRGCYHGNVHPGGAPATTSPPGLQTTNATCDGTPDGANPNPAFTAEVLCDAGISLVPGAPPACPSGPYPEGTQVVMHPLPANLPSMPDPCADVPPNPWCHPGRGGKP